MRNLLFFLSLASLLFSSERKELLDVISKQWVAKSVYAAAKLDVAGHLMNGTKPIEQLARAVNADEDHLYRLMRLLAGHGIFQELPGKNFANSPSSSLLAEKHPHSLRSLVLFYNAEVSKSLDHLAQCVQRGIPAFELTYQKPVFAHFRDNPVAAQLFNQAMKQKSDLVASSCIESYPFDRFGTLYDIGGGTGVFIYALLSKFPRMRGLLFETPEVIAQAKPELEKFGQRCGMIAGDFFKTIPPDGDAYLLKSVLHDWDDQSAIQILRQCASSMKREARLLIIEPLLSKGANESEYAQAMDLLMMTMTGGKERDEADFRYLLQQAGLKIHSITRTETEFVIIEAAR